MASTSTAARGRPRTAQVPAAVEDKIENWRTTVSSKLTRAELLQIALLEGADLIDRYPDRVLGRLYEVRRQAKARKGAQ